MNEVQLLPMGNDYVKHPYLNLDDNLFLYGAPFADVLYFNVENNDGTLNLGASIDLNSSSLFMVQPIAKDVINLYAGDQKYAYIEPVLQIFEKHFAIKRIDLMQASHHGLLAAPVTDMEKWLELKIGNANLNGNLAIISNDFSRFKENHQHKNYLDTNFKSVLATNFDDLIATYEPGSDQAVINKSNT